MSGMADPEKPAGRKRRKPSPPPAVEGDDPARREKIAAIKKAVEDGTYRVSSDDVAQKLIEHMLQPKKTN